MLDARHPFTHEINTLEFGWDVANFMSCVFMIRLLTCFVVFNVAARVANVFNPMLLLTFSILR